MHVIQVLIDTDAKIDIDDQWAITYALCSPELDVVGLTAAHFQREGRQPESVRESLRELQTILRLWNGEERIPVKEGLACNLEGQRDYAENEAVSFIIRQAETVQDLTIIALGPLTNVAAAYLIAPDAISRVRLYWIGGGPWPSGGPEFNLMNDPAALRVMLQSPIEFHWIMGYGAGSQLKVTREQSGSRVKGCGAIGDYLHHLLEQTGKEVKTIYDLAPIAAVKHPQWFARAVQQAPQIMGDGDYRFDGTGREIWTYTHLDAQAVLEEFWRLLAQRTGAERL